MKFSVTSILVIMAIVAVHGLAADTEKVDEGPKPKKRAIMDTIVGAVVGKVIGNIIDRIFSQKNGFGRGQFGRGRFGQYDMDGKEDEMTEIDATASDLWSECNCDPQSRVPQVSDCVRLCVHRQLVEQSDQVLKSGKIVEEILDRILNGKQANGQSYEADEQVAFEESAGQGIDETKDAEPELEVSNYACNGGTIGGFYYQLAKGYSGFCKKRDNCQKVCTSEGHPNGFCAFRPTAGVCTKMTRSCWCTNNRDK